MGTSFPLNEFWDRLGRPSVTYDWLIVALNTIDQFGCPPKRFETIPKITAPKTCTHSTYKVSEVGNSRTVQFQKQVTSSPLAQDISVH